MARSTDIRVNPALLIWARESSGEDVERVANRLNIKVGLVEKWERGEAGLTYRRLEALADLYKRPVAAFFQSHVPLEATEPTDFRSTNGGTTKARKELKLSTRRARFLRNVFEELNPEYVVFKNRQASLSANPSEVAANERERLGVTFQTQKGWRVGPDSFNEWKKILEDAGILVFQNGFETDDVSGFSLGDPQKRPVIVVNSRDAATRKSFTLFHEYCHILLNSSGVCQLKNSVEEFRRDDSIEAFCDKFAAAFLVPKDIFLEQPSIERVVSRLEDEKAIKTLADTFKVSRQVILIQLLLSNKISKEYYDTKKRKFDAEFKAIQAKKKEEQKKKPGGPPRHYMAISENGRPFTKATLNALKRGQISKSDASNYFGVRVRHLPAIESAI